MKIRLGFVSNSSSSSFTCDFCGEECGGMDISLSECEMFNCGSGHTVCLSHRVKVPITELLKVVTADARDGGYTHEQLKERKEDIDACIEEDDVDELLEITHGGDAWYEAPTCLCPICQLEKVLTGDAYNYLLTLVGRTREDVAAEIKGKFSKLDEVYAFIKEKKS